MDDEQCKQQLYAFHDEAKKRSVEIATQKTREMNLPKLISPPRDGLGLGPKIEKEARFFRDRLEEKFGEDLSKILAVALHEFWFACWDGAAYIASCIESGAMNDNAYAQGMATAQGYADREGWANTLCNGFAEIQPNKARIDFIKESMDSDILDGRILLECMALYWFGYASQEHAAGNVETAFDAIHEAYDALILANGLYMWDAAEESAEGNGWRQIARKGALEKLRLDPKQKEKSAVKECWASWQALAPGEKKVRYRGNAAFARDMLTKFENLTNQSVIERWCREWEKGAAQKP